MAALMSRRRMLAATVTLGGAAGAAVLANSVGTARAAASDSQLRKQDVQYQDQPKGLQRCSGCANFEAPSACRVVSGNVNPNGWCLLFKAKQ
jgi:hypothetical protein